MIELLEKCVRIPSLSGHEQAVAHFLVDEMRGLGYNQAFVDEAGSAVGVLGTGKKQLVLLGHIDTVGGDVPVRYEDDTLFGRGTVDAKGPFCAFVLAAAQLRSSIHKDWQIIVVGATEEEAASSKGAHFAATQYQPELCVIGEPSGSDGITLGYKGRLLATAHFEQGMVHTSRPEPTASEKAVMFWNHAKQFAEQYNADKPKMFDQVLPSLRSIRSESDGLREWCDVTAGFRLPLDCDPAAMSVHLNQAFEMSGADEGCELKLWGHEQAYRTSKDTVLARAFVNAIREEKMRPAFKVKSGTADFNILGPAWGCPMVAYGPGDSDLDHTPHEHVDVSEFERGVRVLARVLRELLTKSQIEID